MAARRPMSAKGILDAAYRAEIVPDHLKGRTQHKTLQARLSEDILYHRNASLFYRTEPGVFFLCELIAAPDIPEKYKEKFPARRRTRDLQKESPLGISRKFLKECLRHTASGSVFDILRAAEKHDAIRYLPSTDHDEYAPVWTFSIVRRKHNMLSYRVGRYRDDRDGFANKLTIGFPGAITVMDRSLFSQDDYGAADSALSVLLLDLDISPQSFPNGEPSKPKPLFAFEAEGDDGISVLLVVLEWTCPDWFEPTTRRLSLNDPRWLDLSARRNNLDDFEPWSKTAFCQVVEHGLKQSE
jgi:hypothetical protein